MTHTIDTTDTLNALAKARRVALNRIMYEVRTQHEVESIKSTVEALLVELATVEKNIVGNS